MGNEVSGEMAMKRWACLFLDALLKSLQLVESFTTQSFVPGLLLTNGVKLCKKSSSLIISWTRLGC